MERKRIFFMAQLFLVGSIGQTLGVTVGISPLNGRFFRHNPLIALWIYALQTWHVCQEDMLKWVHVGRNLPIGIFYMNVDIWWDHKIPMFPLPIDRNPWKVISYCLFRRESVSRFHTPTPFQRCSNFSEILRYLGCSKKSSHLPTIDFQKLRPGKINMEPTNHPFRKENDLPNLHDYVPC